MIKIRIDNRVFDESVENLQEYIAVDPWQGYFIADRNEHYKLLKYISKNLPDNSKITDLGTHLGSSALALSANKKVTIYTYDIQEMIPKNMVSIRHIDNVKYIIKDATKCIDDYIDSSVIVLDVDPHDGLQEYSIINQLIDKKYKGLVVCDDIHLNEGMKLFWNWVPLKKYDVTKYGHFSGTGIIVFDEKTINVDVNI